MKRNIFIILLIFSCFNFVKAQEKVYLPFFEVLNMHPDYQYSSSKLFKTYVDNLNVFTIILPEKKDTLYKETLVQTMQNAQKAGAGFFAVGEINSISETVIVISLTLYKTADGSKVWNDMIKSRSLSDLDPTMQRMAKAMSSKTKASEEQDIYNVSNYEARQLQKVNASYYWGLTVGGGIPFGFTVNNPSAGVGGMLSYDGRNFMIDIKAEGYFGDFNVYAFDIDVMYPFNDKRHTPFVGGGMGISGANAKINENFEHSGGLMLTGGGGYLFNRNADVNFRVGARMFLCAYKVGNTAPAGILFNITILLEN
ncbi:MAG: hypothetical protein HY958_03575 [Bacteroidia bacterium]|nr:hypothetical protein [Bacteroidia bacterium]